jgi:carbon monoxide dehydrogenase subunit G
MTMNVKIDLGYEFDVKANASDVFEVLSDVPTSASYFPKVDKLVDLGGNGYRWVMDKIGIASVNIQTIYASKYVSDKTKGIVVWSPIKSEGNALMWGSWTIRENKKTTNLVLQINGDLEIPLPSMMKMVVAPIVTHEYEKMIEKYIDNLTRKFGAEVHPQYSFELR